MNHWFRRYSFTLAVLALACGRGSQIEGQDHIGLHVASPPACAAAWNSATQYSGGTTVSRACGGAGIVDNYTANYSSKGMDPCSNWGLSRAGRPWLTPQGCGTIPPPIGPGVSNIITSGYFDVMAPPVINGTGGGNRNAAYTQAGLVNGASGFPTFCAAGGTNTEIEECAAFMANAALETQYFIDVNEVNPQGPPNEACYCQGGGPCSVVCDPSNPSSNCTAPTNNWYYGRGWLQLSWDFNYCSAGSYLGITLINNANALTDPTTTTQASLWYWMTQIGPNTIYNESAHDCIVNGQGFGCTIMSINGAVECPSLPGKHKNTNARDARITFFHSFLSILGGTDSNPGGDSC